MVDQSLSLRIGAIISIFFISLLGFFGPLYIKYSAGVNNLEVNWIFLLLKSFASGTILSVALLHLLNDSISDLALYTDYPLALALAMSGIVITLGLDQVTMLLIHNRSSLISPESETRTKSYTPTPKPDLHVVENGESNTNAHEHVHTHNMLLVPDKNAQKAFVKTLILEISIAIHSIIIGVSFGGLGEDSIGTIKVLWGALAFHQFFEGISLGSAISDSNVSISSICFFAFIFAFSFSMGGIIGITTTEPNSTGILVQGCFNAIAAGSLIYSALVEMMAEDFSSSELNNKLILKSAMFFSLILGCLGMAVLALYA